MLGLFLLFCTELSLFCTVFEKNCTALNQSKWRNFFMYIINNDIAIPSAMNKITSHVTIIIEEFKDDEIT